MNENRKPLQRLSMSTRNYTVSHYLTAENRPEMFQLDPPYQRGSVWTVEQRRALIQSMYLGLPFGAVTVNDRDLFDDDVQERYGSPYYLGVIDGRQRIETIRAFAAGGFSIPAWWLEDRDKLEGVGEDVDYSGLSEAGRRRFENIGFPMQTTSVTGLAAEADIFLLLNGGGTAQDDASMARAAKVAGK